MLLQGLAVGLLEDVLAAVPTAHVVAAPLGLGRTAMLRGRGRRQRQWMLAPRRTLATARPMQQQQQQDGPVTRYIRQHFRHFNSATVIEAAQGWRDLIQRDGKLMVTLAGAMSTGRPLKRKNKKEKKKRKKEKKRRNGSGTGTLITTKCTVRQFQLFSFRHMNCINQRRAGALS